MASWDETLQGAFGSVVDAGANLIKAQADEAARRNNAGTTPSMAKMQPWMIYAGVALALAVVFLAVRKR